jgi:thiamine-phosphate pyrophosphorylase
MIALPARGLYVITPDALCAREGALLPAVTSAIRGGAVLVQYRDKVNPPARRRELAQRLGGLCQEAGVPLLLNDGPVADALALGLNGVHLGVGDGDLAGARAAAPPLIIGATCGASLDRARAAEVSGASYVAFGAFFPSTTKPEAAAAPLALLTQARRALRIPLCAIGGITPQNAAPLIAAGADYVAAVSGVFGADDIEAAARAYARLFAP